MLTTQVTHFESKTKSTLILIRDLLIADDKALKIPIINAFSDASKKFRLIINIKKTKMVPIKNIM